MKMFSLILIILIVPRDLYAATVSQYAANPIPSYQYTNNYGSYQVVCPANQFRCTSGLCIHESLRCNGVVECPSGDDEQLCPTSSSTTASPVTAKSSDSTTECAPNTFYKCQKSKRCIPWSQLCDGKIHCLFGDDENQSNCKLVPGFGQQGTIQQNETVSKVQSINNETNVTESSFYQPTTYDYSNQGNYSTGGAGATEVKVNKVVQSSDHTANTYYPSKDDSGFVFVNFGPIINGDSNVNGNGNDLGNGNGNGNENGNGNGNGNGNENGNGINSYYQRFKPSEEDYKNYYNEGRSH